MEQTLDKVYEAIWAQTAKLLAAESFSIALCGPKPSQVTYEMIVDRGVRQVPQTRELGDGLSDLVVRTGKPLLVRNFELEEGSMPLSWMGAPMTFDGNVLGLVSVQTYREQAYQPKDLSILAMLAGWAASAVEAARSYRAQKQEAESATALLRVTRVLAAETEELGLLRSAVEIVPTLVECDRCTAWWWVAERQQFEPAWRYNAISRKAEEFTSASLVPTGVPALGRVMETLETVAVDGAAGGQLGDLRDSLSMELQSVALVPLVQGGELVALIAAVRSQEGEEFNPREIDLLRGLADIAALALQNLRHHRQKGEAAALRELNEMKSRLISTISHELRTPLSFVQAGSELLMQRLLDPEQLRQVAGLVNQGSSRLAEIVDDVILFADLQSGLVSVSPVAVNPASVVRDAIEDVVGAANGERVHLEVIDPVPTVHLDPDKLRSAISRLVRNALNFSLEPSVVQVRVSVPSDRVQIEVSDKGFGIPKGDVERVFEPFFRGEVTQARCIPGTGLGLSIVKQLIGAMGGQVVVDSEPGRGTAVTVFVPVGSHEAEDLQAAPNPGQSVDPTTHCR